MDGSPESRPKPIDDSVDRGDLSDRANGPADTSPTPDHGATGSTTGARPRALAIGAAAAVLVLLVGIVVLASRGHSVVTTVAAADAIPGPTTEPDATTTTEAAWSEEATTTEAPSTTSPPAQTETQAPINLTRPSTVLTGATVGQIPVFTAPGGAVKITLPHPRAINGDPNASVPLILLAKQQQGDWIEAYLPVRPNGSTGWVRRRDFTTSTHDYLIEVRLSQFNIKVFNGTKLIMNTAIGVATDNTPTPGGLYYTTELLAPPNPAGPYGPYAYGLSGFSNVHTSFAGGPGQLGLHGTNQPGAIGRKVSNGCIRLTNQDITFLAKQLPLGVPVAVYR